MNDRELATRNEILRTRVGSTVHGCGIDDQDDRDELGICVEPPEYVLGLGQFEQYVHRTQPEGVRSGPGDLDLTIYSLRKWTRLAVQGNPSILVPLYVPKSDVVLATELGRELRELRDVFVSRQAGHRFLGYLRGQREKLLGQRGNVTKRPELVERYGFDTKFAYHMVRLGLQGVELLETGRLTLPLGEHDREWLVALRRGERTLGEALETTEHLEAKLALLVRTDGCLRVEPDYGRVNQVLVDLHMKHWKVYE